MTQSASLAILTDSAYFDHDTGGGEHPESPVRLEVILEALRKSPVHSALSFHQPMIAERSRLLAAHEENWLFRFEEGVLSGKSYIDHPDNQICYDSYNIACLAAGAGITAVDLIETGVANQAFCLVRPPGHHAEKNMPFGFCFLNNTVIAARYLQQRYGRKRVLIFDFDAHHGNGIQSAFEREADTCYISIHEHPSFSYPGTGYADEVGLGIGAGTILNIPLSPGAGDVQILAALDEKVEPRLVHLRPEAIVVAAGFDGHCKDDMSGLLFSTDLYREMGRRVKKWADIYCQGRLLSILEGGYELTVLGESVEAYVQGLLGV
jgi:acetoin utilization deacetylase AcuC-like enzyme